MVETIYHRYSIENFRYFNFLALKGKSFWRKQYYQLWKSVCSIIIYKIVLSRYKQDKRIICDSVRSDVVVALTSFPKRIHKVWFTIESILAQSVRPSKILLYLSEAEFKEAQVSLPVYLEKYKKYGLEVIWVKENLRSHNKYFYALQAYKDKFVITVDDDLYYPSYTIERLLQIHARKKDAVCANITRVINKSKFLDYSRWGKDPDHQKYNGSSLLVALGYGGVLYPPIFRPNELFDIESIKELAFYADDLWLKAIELITGTYVITGDYYAPPITTPHSQKIALRKKNCGVENRNNLQWKNLADKFDLNRLIFSKDTR